MTDNTPAYEWASWSEPGELQQEPLSPDRLGRAAYAEFLTHYLNNVGQRDGGYVINLNAEWGAGKTWFLKRWCATLKPHHPVAYIDAWKNDFSDDPLLTVVSGVLEALKQNPSVNFYKHEKDLFGKIGHVSKVMLPALFKGVLRTYAGVNTDDLLDDGLAEGVGEAFQNLVGSHQQKLQSLDDSRKAIADWLHDVTTVVGEGKLDMPMYVFIDELDRCRPTYAIELLETVKHLFEIKGIVFVIATNTDQLQHSIRAVYGEGFDANRYLYRFFNRSASLPQVASMKFFIDTSAAGQLLKNKLSVTGSGAVKIDPDNLTDVLGCIAERFCFDLRTCNQWLEQLAAVYSNEEVGAKFFWLVTALMIAMRLSEPELYSQVLSITKADRGSYHDEVKNSFLNKTALVHEKKTILKLEIHTLHLIRATPDGRINEGEVWSELPDQVSAFDVVNNVWIADIRNVFEPGIIQSRLKNYEAYQLQYPEAFWIAANYFCVEQSATREGYIALVDQAGLLL